MPQSSEEMAMCEPACSRYFLPVLISYLGLDLRGFEARGDQIGVDPLTFWLEVDPIFHEEIGPADARSVPIDKYGVRVLLYLVGQHVVIRLLPGARGLHVHKHHLAHIREHPHHLVELLGGEGAIGADMDDYDVAERTSGMAALQDGDRICSLKTHIRLDGRVIEGSVELPGGANHHRVAYGGDPAHRCLLSGGGGGGGGVLVFFRWGGGGVGGVLVGGWRNFFFFV